MDAAFRALTWIEPGRIAAMARPTAQEIALLGSLGVRALLSLTEEASAIGRTAIAEGIDWLHVPIEDFDIPSLEEVDEAVAFICRTLEHGGAVAVHCGAGLGRTGTIIACHLVATGMTPEAAVSRVRLARPGSIETSAQEDLVRKYADHLSDEPLRDE